MPVGQTNAATSFGPSSSSFLYRCQPSLRAAHASASFSLPPHVPQPTLVPELDLTLDVHDRLGEAENESHEQIQKLRSCFVYGFF